MARRDKNNAHRSGSAADESVALREEIERLKAKLRQVEGERDDLRARNADLERSNAIAVERIDRVVTSLESLLAEG